MPAVWLLQDTQLRPQVRVEILRPAFGRSQQYRETWSVRQNPARERKAIITAGHLDVGKNALDCAIVLEKQERVVTAGSFEYLETPLSEELADLCTDACVILHHENVRVTCSFACR
jgi:hypothetical protein